MTISYSGNTGEVSFYPDLLSMEILSDKIEFNEFVFRFPQDTVETPILLKDGDKVKVGFNLRLKEGVVTDAYKLPFVLAILPNNYLTCNGESIITDTLKMNINMQPRKAASLY